MVRVSGPDALKVVDRVFTAVSGKQAEDTPGYRGLFGRVHDGQGEIEDVYKRQFSSRIVRHLSTLPLLIRFIKSVFLPFWQRSWGRMSEFAIFS